MAVEILMVVAFTLPGTQGAFHGLHDPVRRCEDQRAKVTFALAR